MPLSPLQTSADRAPNHAYYRSVHGRWATKLDFALTDRRAFWACPMGWLDHARLLSMTFLPRLLGPLVLETSVDYETNGERGEVVHTTRVSKLGVTLLASRETIVLGTDGRRFDLRGEMRLFPTPWRARSFGEGRGEVDASGKQASYRFEWFGTEMDQRGEFDAAAGTVTLTQATAFSRGVQVLRRASPA